MRNILFAVRFWFLVLLFASATTAAFGASQTNKNYVAGELLIKYTDGTAGGAARAANLQMGASVVREFPEIGWQLVRLPKNLTVETALINYRNFPGVALAQPNYFYKLAVTPNDPSYGALYGMTKIGAPAAWKTTIGSQEIVVAVIDTGVRRTHEDIAANMWQNSGETAANGIDDDGNGYVDDVYGWDVFSNDADVSDEYDHGTHCAGTIGAVGNNLKGVVGVNWNVRIMALKIYDASGNTSTAAHIIGAYQYVRTMKLRGVNVRVTSNSYGGAPEAADYDQATKDAIDAVGELDILNVFAAGNGGTNNDLVPHYPSNYTSPHILAVAASNQSDNKAGFSQYGATSVDLAAPGVSILSLTKTSDTSYGNKSGTSMATPHAAGAAALLAAANPNLSAASLKASLMNSVDLFSNWNGIVKSGGRLNIANAISTQTVCNFSLSAPSQNAPAAGGNFSLNVSALTNCDFGATTQDSWISITSGNPGSGNTTVDFTVAANAGAARTGVIRIAGQNFNIQQSGAANVINRAPLDFDNDRRTDYTVIQNVNGGMFWQILRSTAGYSAVQFGSFAADVPVPADYDGDGQTDIAVWRGGAANEAAYFFVLKSATNTFQVAQWGTTGDAPLITQDFDNDRRADFAVTRLVNNELYWYVIKSGGGFIAQQFGFAGDKPLRGDFDGDGRADLAVYRPANLFPANTFFVLKSSDNSFLSQAFGNSTIDRAVSGDFDGDLKTDIAVWRATNGYWYWLDSNGGQFRAAQWGASGDTPTPGDYDADGKTDLAVWRPNEAPNQSGIFYVIGSTNNFSAVAWGQNGMLIPAGN